MTSAAPAVRSRPSSGRIPPASRWLPKRVFYGWYLSFGCMLFTFVGVGVGYYGLALFLKPLRQAHGWSNGQVSGAIAVYFVVSGIAGYLVGPPIDRRGPLPFMLGGACLMGAAVVAVGHVHALWQLYVVYVILAIGYGSSSAVAVSTLLTRWFVHRRAQATSISSTGPSLGGVILVPLGTRLLDSGGLETVTLVLGILLVAISVPVVLLVLAADPADLGLEPDGGAPRKDLRATRVDEATQTRVWTRSDASRTVSYWAIVVAFVFILAAQTGFLLHQISYLEGKYGSRQKAAIAVSTAAMGSIIARLVVGRFVDPLDKRFVASALCFLQAAAVLMVIHTTSLPVVFAMTLVFGFTIGNVYMMQQLLVAEIFGVPSFGAIYGVIVLTGQVASGMGPLGVGFFDDRFGSYTVPFTVTAALTACAGFVVLFARPVPARPLTRP